MQNILFVCLGNICRSPMAEFIMRDLLQQQGLSARVQVDSAGTSGWHDGEDMHGGTAEILDEMHINSSGFRSSKVKASDFEHFDFLVAMDHDNLRQLEALFGVHPDKMFVITDLVPELGYHGVPDPWYTHDFNETRTLLQAACQQLLHKL
ncbi:low molecular weight phosphotyrosine protein phosphatase [Vitreoscilla massiliensis]|uniref:protein-tyrosine-phosphatase n=1 Tax=Vitreoscilla massiliensis TaxID=1689272 RepID=A0ABY4DYB7_9NEIS|nr:low molecular weight protein-tyrosine-phosphatase [Vitreoscilla massiliensis]UOO88523.1 low molecular weight phosphotyrosine protein phosphatase [Vitreoscilla massiliensis]